MRNAALARPAQFDRATQHRRSMIAKINVARHQLDMAEDDYRQLLLNATGKISLKDCNDSHLSLMLDALKSKGFRPIQSKGKPRPASTPMAGKARAMWISLYHLGVVHNPGEGALEAFAKRQLKCERMAWANQSDAYKIIEALKGMAVRHGWVQVDHKGKPLGPIGLQESLCNAIVARLKEADAIPLDWSLHIAAERLCGISTAQERPFSADQHRSLAAALGQQLRDMTDIRGGNE